MMFKKYRAVFFLLCLCAWGLMAFQNNPSSLIGWKADRPLTWDDFTAQPDFRSEKTAYTKSRIKSKWNYTGEKLTYKVMAIFETKSSWARQPRTDRLLAHEQLHFDITEAYARMLRREFALMKDPDMIGSDRIKKVTRGVREEWYDRQKEYDRETDHSVNEEAQARWEQEIQELLESLSEYASVTGSNQ